MTEEETRKREKLEAKRYRKEAGKDVYCSLCGKEIGDWPECECYKYNSRRKMVEGDL